MNKCTATVFSKNADQFLLIKILSLQLNSIKKILKKHGFNFENNLHFFIEFNIQSFLPTQTSDLRYFYLQLFKGISEIV